AGQAGSHSADDRLPRGCRSTASTGPGLSGLRRAHTSRGCFREHARPTDGGFMCAARQSVLVLLLLSLPGAVSAARAEDVAQHVSIRGGGGIGSVLTGEDAPYVNGHKMVALSASLPGDKVRVRLLKGSLERTQGIESGTGDNDLDYQGLDVVFT